MKIKDAKAAYSGQMQALWTKKRALTAVLKEQESGGDAFHFDRVELSKELERVDAAYEASRRVMEGIMAAESAIHDSVVAKQQTESLGKQAKMLSKMLEIYRRIASGGKVPPEDEQALLEFSKELYMAAKMAAMAKRDKDDKEYDSLLEDEDASGGESVDAAEAAENAEISVPSPEAAASAGGEASGIAE